ncbi:FAD-dependent oxidoreductase [Nonlabens sp. SCSIO 43208]|uniref:NAD(P)/FAD-dependent oxidoreductase n=1 Tax=Nonlabens sp. SCSIO 43208 TaxID=2793009 RepID=UPI003D6C4B4E
MKDTLIIGGGISGCTLAWQWYFNDKSFTLVTDQKKGSSAVAAGVYNPTILKRFTSVWKAQEQLEYMLPFYQKIEKQLDCKLLHPYKILRRLHDNNEQKTWVAKSEKPELKPFMKGSISSLKIDGINAPFGYGEVTQTGWLDTLTFMSKSYEFFKNLDSFHAGNDDGLSFDNQSVIFNTEVFDHVIYAEGYAIKDNAKFNYLPLQGNKGEIMLIKAPDLKLNAIIKAGVFIMPYKDDMFWVGATYNRHDLSDNISHAGAQFLSSRLEKILTVPYEIVEYKWGIRPTTVDRRPFLGAHPNLKNHYVFNGMGSRAVLIAPWASEQLHNSIFKNSSLHLEIDIQRFR